ncbi:MAG: N-acetylmuramoyl-L-alanine amidase [Rhodothermia bacterium]|nr:MAG: N-acetylmuramoyl-L-alanine amidase [Rhodothermia bacterium]
MRFRHIPFFFILLAFSTVATAQSQTDFPERGEGIFRLLSRNGITPTKAVLAEFRDLNADKLINGSGLRRGVAYSLPSTVVTKTYEIFGDEFKTVTIKSNTLKGVVYYILGGHGGRDPGAIGRRNGKFLYEDEYAYDVSLRLARGLIAEGATVYILNRDDEGIRNLEYFPADHDEKHLGGKYIGNSQRDRLRQRVKDINRLAARHRNARLQRVVELHVDSYRSTKQVDVDFYYNSRQGLELAKTLRKTIGQQYSLIRPDRGYRGRLKKGSYLYMLRNTVPVTALIELGNINHKGDQLRIIQWDNRQFIADWLTLGFIEDAKKSAV